MSALEPSDTSAGRHTVWLAEAERLFQEAVNGPHWWAKFSPDWSELVAEEQAAVRDEAAASGRSPSSASAGQRAEDDVRRRRYRQQLRCAFYALAVPPTTEGWWGSADDALGALSHRSRTARLAEVRRSIARSRASGPEPTTAAPKTTAPTTAPEPASHHVLMVIGMVDASGVGTNELLAVCQAGRDAGCRVTGETCLVEEQALASGPFEDYYDGRPEDALALPSGTEITVEITGDLDGVYTWREATRG